MSASMMGDSEPKDSIPATQGPKDGAINFSFRSMANSEAAIPSTICLTGDDTGPPKSTDGTTPDLEITEKPSGSPRSTENSGVKGDIIIPFATEPEFEEDTEILTKLYASNILLKAYERTLRDKAEKNKKPKSAYGPMVVEGLVDYLRLLENRMDLIEKNIGLEEGGEDTWGRNGKHSPSKPISDPSVKIGIKFFDAAAVLTEDGWYSAHSGRTSQGTFICDTNGQYLIRVLYSRKNYDEIAPTKYADLQAPNPDDIDIINFGVASEAISTFFAKHLDIGTRWFRDVVRFGKPFRAVLRGMHGVRRQLKQLEERYENVATESAEHHVAPADSKEAKSAPDDGSARPPFTSLGSDKRGSQEDEIEPFERPTAIAHFRAFIGFVDKYLGREIKQYQLLREGKARTVAFENLWMLFDCNETIYCPLRDGSESYENVEKADATEARGTAEAEVKHYIPVKRYSPQAYRVVATSGGVPFATAVAPSYRKGRPTNLRDQDAIIGIADAMNAVAAERSSTDAIFSHLPIHDIARTSQEVRKSYSELNVHCFYLDFDGARYGMVPDVFVFRPYEREMEIRNLQAYPIKYASNHKLEERGKRFLDVTKIAHLQYDGLTVGPNRDEISSPVVIDFNLAFQYQGVPGLEHGQLEVPTFGSMAGLWRYNQLGQVREVAGSSRCSKRWCYSDECLDELYSASQRGLRHKVDSEIKLILEEYESENQRGGNQVNDFHETLLQHDLVKLLPGVVPGFALRLRRWGLLRLDRLSPIQQSSQWDKLVLPRGHQKMVQAMVETYTLSLGSSRDQGMGMDIVRGKGAGCIILLHGVPGVGKTSTAECVAAHTQKPLYPITCGDIGYIPREVEMNLTGHFKLAHRWGCVLLLDEADVFLAKRDKQDVQRNGLVSVFLRVLEYYSGILFLTTNRVGAIDDAFRSRLHLTLYYPRLTPKQTKSIFKNNFSLIKEINAERTNKGLLPFEYEHEKEEIMEWATSNYKKLRWNGRQIRNAFQTVLALTEFDANEAARRKNKPVTSLSVTKKHFMVIADATDQFNKYLLRTHGKDEEDIARREAIRALDSSSEEEEESSSSHSSNDSSDDGESKEEEDGSESSSESESEAPRKKKKKMTRNSSSSKKEKQSKSGGRGSKKNKRAAANEEGLAKKSTDKKGKKKSNDSDSD